MTILTCEALFFVKEKVKFWKPFAASHSENRVVTAVAGFLQQ